MTTAFLKLLFIFTTAIFIAAPDPEIKASEDKQKSIQVQVMPAPASECWLNTYTEGVKNCDY